RGPRSLRGLAQLSAILPGQNCWQSVLTVLPYVASSMFLRCCAQHRRGQTCRGECRYPQTPGSQEFVQALQPAVTPRWSVSFVSLRSHTRGHLSPELVLTCLDVPHLKIPHHLSPYSCGSSVMPGCCLALMHSYMAK